MGAEIVAAPMPYISPVAAPLLDGKALNRSLKLIQAICARERDYRAKNKEGRNLEDQLSCCIVEFTK